MRLAWQRLRVGAQRDPDVHTRRLAAIGEAARVSRRRQHLQCAEIAGVGDHADDGVRPFVQAQLAANGGARAAGGSPRQRLADDGGIGGADRILLRREPAARHGTDAQHRQKFTRDPQRGDPDGLAVLGRQVDLSSHQR